MDFSPGGGAPPPPPRQDHCARVTNIHEVTNAHYVTIHITISYY